jgi:hypothetical protein
MSAEKRTGWGVWGLVVVILAVIGLLSAFQAIT